MVIIFGVSPIIFGVVMYANMDNLDHPSIEKKIGTMYLGVWKSKGWGLTYSVVFLVRRTLFVILTFALYDQPGIQIQLFIYMSVLYMIYLHAQRIYAQKYILLLEAINEVVFLLACYHLVLFANLLPDPETLETVGSSMIVTLVLLVAITGSVMVGANIKNQYGNYRKWKAKKAQKKAIEA